MLPHNSTTSEARRAYHRELRSVARTLRLTGIAFALLGLAGLLLGILQPGWWVPPSWFSLIIGAVLIAAGGVSRVREEGRPPDQL